MRTFETLLQTHSTMINLIRTCLSVVTMATRKGASRSLSSRELRRDAGLLPPLAESLKGAHYQRPILALSGHASSSNRRRIKRLSI